MHDEIIAYWVKHIGIGFDPICRACDYDIPLNPDDAVQYDKDMSKLWLSYGSNGELEGAILDEMTKQGIIP